MPNSRHINADEARNITLGRIQAFRWPDDSFCFPNDKEQELSLYLNGLATEKYGRELSDLEECYERARWLRGQAVHRNMTSFVKLRRDVHAFVLSLVDSHRMNVLAELAGLISANESTRPSSEIPFQPIEILESPPLLLSDYETEVGGPHIFGARVLWWCAAAETPDKFGYAIDFNLRLMHQPFWFTNVRSLELQANKSLLELLYETASRIDKSPAPVGSPEPLMVTSATKDEKEKDGPLLGCGFRYDGKTAKLTKQQHKALSALWNNRFHKMQLNEFQTAIWGDKIISKKTPGSLVARLNNQLDKEGLANLSVFIKNEMIELEISKPTAN